ncbi:C40 family peptidase [Nocardioides sp. SYSU DS0663]|uniref:C40 family peptidase n=1 Tax=Nocardioides sp. SYSU DS0663 TaxID=3416445 RepID=UPI003F4C5074
MSHALDGALLRARIVFCALTAALALSLAVGVSPLSPTASAAGAQLAQRSQLSEIEKSRTTERRRARVSRSERLMRVVRRQNGDPYAWGASGPHRFDCSGLTQFVYRNAIGERLPHSSRAQVSRTRRISRGAARPGDLVFFHNGGRVYHVAVYAGRGRIWHAPGSGKRVTRAPIWTRSHFYGRVR